MLWFEGSIAEAVSQSKEKNAIFVVFVEGEDELSTELSATLQQSDVARRLDDSQRFLAIKLSSSSENYAHFTQIYKFVPVPSLFFIGQNGTPLEVVCGGIEPAKLTDRIDRILEEHYKFSPSTSSRTLGSASSSFIQAESAATGVTPAVPATPSQAEVPASKPQVIPPQAEVAGSLPQATPSQAEMPATEPQVTPPKTEVAGSMPLVTPSQAEMPATEPQVTPPKTEVAGSMPLVTPSQAEMPASKPPVAPSKAEVPVTKPQVSDTQAEVPAVKVKVEASPVHSTPKTDAAVTRKDTVPAEETKPESRVAAAPSAPEYEVVCDGDVCVRRPKVAAAAPGTRATPTGPSTEQMVVEASPPEPPAALDDRVERAKELIESKRREKEALEKELERQRELERRATGQGVAELRRWQADQELKQAAEERRREKAENDAARQRIREQIALDRVERRARAGSPAGSPSPPPPASTAASSPCVALVAAGGEGGSPSPHARIQFKLADGSSHAAQFDADSTLAELHAYVAANLQQSGEGFTLWTAFPRRELAASAETLRSLDLAPSAALLVLAASGAAPPAAAAGALPDVVTRLYTGTVYPRPRSRVDFAVDVCPALRLRGDRLYAGAGAWYSGVFLSGLLASVVLQPLSGVWSWIGARLRPAPPAALPARRSNVHRLAGGRAPDDDNTTWNGNSTQQM